MKLSPATKVGILTLLSVVILIFGIMWLKGRSISAGERIEVRFQDVDGMEPGSAVQMMGIRIGQVEEVIPVINQEESYVQVKFVITEPAITIPTASTISIQQSGIIGEKFLEITPPQIQTIFLPVTRKLKTLLAVESPVKLLSGREYINVGEIKTAEIVDSRTLTQPQQENIKTSYAYKVGYIVTKPGIIVPKGSIGSIETLVSGEDSKEQELRLIPPFNILVQAVSSSGRYTVIEPMRLKEFFDIQLQSAIALQETNDKINILLSDEVIADLKTTFKNTKTLTTAAGRTLDQASDLLISSKTEIDTLVTLATQLSNKMITLSDNINNIVSDPELKNNLIATTTSIQKSAKSLSIMLDDPKLKETFDLVNSSAKDLAEITQSMNSITKDQELKAKLSTTLTNLNTSLSKLSITLDNVNNLSESDKQKLKAILEDSSEISQNLRQFSDKLNKKFLLLRLLF